MPRRTDLHHVLVIGSGPIVIGQACEFDYSGTQACRVLRAEGLQVSLVNSNPATIMTDPEFADHTYVEPITPAFVERVIAQQAERGNKIDALLATLGGQTALNTAVALYESGVLEKYGVELIGADFDAIQRERWLALLDQAGQPLLDAEIQHHAGVAVLAMQCDHWPQLPALAGRHGDHPVGLDASASRRDERAGDPGRQAAARRRGLERRRGRLRLKWVHQGAEGPHAGGSRAGAGTPTEQGTAGQVCHGRHDAAPIGVARTATP